MKIRMKKFMAITLSVMLLLTAFVVPQAFVSAADAITVRLHYLREDGNYDSWSVWFWGTGDGFAVDFSGSDADGAIATAEFTDSPTQIGFIVRKGNWEQKDPDGDRFIQVNDVVSGTIDVYCVSGSTEFTQKNGADVVTGTKLKSASAESKTVINYELTAEDNSASASSFAIADGKGDSIAIKSVTPNGTKGKIELSTEIDYTKTYTISYNGALAIEMDLPDYFSTAEFENEYTYDGDDLGATWTAEKTSFRVWAPTANKIELNLYKTGDGDDLIKTVEMTKDVKGTWIAEETGDLNGTYYTYTAYFDGKTNKDIVDPYARTVGVNGKRGMIVNLDSTDPSGWNTDTRKVYASPTDLSIYELHIRDFSSDEDSGITNKGKYIAFTETGTKNSNGTATGIDHLKELGITSVHILPSYDFASVDETKLDTKAQYNWGYDPQNYNAPEGSYSTDPYKGEVRVNEYKQMVQSLHNANIGVIMDVVFNHTYNTQFSMNLLVPDYYYRPNSNGSGCGNDVASERSMVRKFIVDTVAYWAEEYHLDGFRFDLMGLEDVETMNAIQEALNKINPHIYVYGEGWTLNTNVTKSGTELATQKNAVLTPSIGYFSDNIRDAIKGSVFTAKDKGYVNGSTNKATTIKDGVMGTPTWSPNPTQTINYSSCHDNLTLWDKINSSNGDDSEADKIKQNLLAAAIVYTAQGVPFIQAGEELLRTKLKDDGTFDHNSYSSPDSVNLLDYSRLDDYKEVYDYYKGLIEFRKYHAGLRMATNADVTSYLKFVEDGLDKGVIAYSIDGAANGEASDGIFVIYNPNTADTTVT
ncbi:MAG: type I pullulanase, partial [Acutalibacteraceae bacterium]